MPIANEECLSTQFLNSLKHLQTIRNYEGEQSKFWHILFKTLITISDADAGMICLRKEQQEWKILVSGPDTPQASEHCKQLAKLIPSAAKQCEKAGCACIAAESSSIIAVNLIVDVKIQKCMALFFLSDTDITEAKNGINALLSVRDIPAQYRLQQSAFEALKIQNRMTDILDILVVLNSQHRFIAAAMTVCNELAARYHCDRVSLGWLEKGYVRVMAMSHTDHFEKKMEAVEKLEIAMEEAMDQNADICFPAPDSGFCISRDHEVYAKSQDVKYLSTFPIREKGKVTGLVTFERNSSPFSSIDLRQLRITIDQLTTRIIELRKRDRWFGARIADWLRRGLSKVLGYEHTWAKLLAIIAAAATAAISLIPVDYRVSSPMILRTDDITYITAPFDGYIDSVGFGPGEIVKANNALVQLDTRDLLLEEAELLAQKNRERREIEKARAAGELADMCIAQARYNQVNAKLDINQHKLSQAIIKAPYKGVIIEGDLREKSGSPIRQGDMLFKIGRIKDIYAEAKVSESEIQNINESSKGQIALASRPQDLFDIEVELVEPSAEVTEKDNVFLVRCRFRDTIPSWFRPGMTGISKINSEKKTILWIVTHRTIDFIRLKLWW